MPTLSLPYGQTALDFRVPDSVTVKTLFPRRMQPLEIARAGLNQALENPVGCPPLKQLARGARRRALIICPDHTRVCGKRQALPWLLDTLNANGIPDDRITILVALGSHIPPDEEKIAGAIGSAAERVEVVFHDAEGPTADCGRTSRSTPVQVNARLKEHDLVVLYSSVVYHYFAGYGGGRKLIIPGIASLETIRANHSLTWLSAEKGGGKNPKSASGILDGNPVHEDMLEAARMALRDTPALAVTAVLTSEGEFGHFSAGEIGQAHRAACDFVDRHNLIEIDEPADLVFASAGGHPKDINFIQAHKGLDNAVKALKPGGTVVYTMACPEGLGDPVMEEFVPLDTQAIKERLFEHYVVFGQTIHAMKLKTAAFRVICVTALGHDVLSDLGATHAAGPDEAVALVEDELSRAGRVYLIPRADVTLPRLS